MIYRCLHQPEFYLRISDTYSPCFVLKERQYARNANRGVSFGHYYCLLRNGKPVRFDVKG